MSEAFYSGALQSGQLANFFNGNFLTVTGEVIFRRQEKHTVTLFALAHGDAGAVPVSGFHFSNLVFIMTTGAERRTKIFLVFGKSFENNCRDTGINTKVRVSALCIAFCEALHDFEVFLGSLSHDRTASFNKQQQVLIL